MSGLYLLALIAIWLFLGWVIYRFWRQWQPEGFSGKILRIGVGVLVFLVWFGGAFWQVTGKKMYWDARVREMCAKDGGIQVNEKVELPAEMFDKWGMVNFFRPSKNENALGPDFIFKREQFYFHKKPSISRIHYKILHRASGRILGETIFYTRSGGDLPGPWEPSWYSCPSTKNVGSNKLLKNVFINKDRVK